jgi:hypothetical protein
MGATSHAYLRVKNAAPCDIMVSNISTTHPAFQVSDNETLMGAVRASLGDAPVAVILSGAEHDFPIFVQVNDLDERGRASFSVSWRKVTSTEVPQIPKHVRISFKSLKVLVAASDRTADRR